MPPRRSSTSTWTPSSPPWSSATSRRCAASRSSSAGPGVAASCPLRRTRPGSSASGRRCPAARHAPAARTRPSSAAGSTPTARRARGSCRCCATSPPSSSRCRSTRPSSTSPPPGCPTSTSPTVTEVGEELRRRVHEVTGGLTATVGIASSKFLAKVASELDKPDGMTVVPPGTELDLLRPMKVTVIPGVGPATDERLRRAGIHTIAELEQVERGRARPPPRPGTGPRPVAARPRAGLRPVVAEREAKSISVEGTYDADLNDRKLMEGLLTRQAKEVGTRMRKNGFSGRTVSIKVRLHDFTTLSRSSTLSSPTDDGSHDRPHRPLAARRPRHHRRRPPARRRRLRAGGLGAGGPLRRRRRTRRRWRSPSPSRRAAPGRPAPTSSTTRWAPGWVWGSGSGVVTVRFETAETPPGPVRSFAPTTPHCTAGNHPPRTEPHPVRSTTGSPGRSWAHRSRSSSSTTATTG